MIYADYEYYKDEYRKGYTGGSFLSAEAFPFLAGQASAYIDNFTKGMAERAGGEALERVKQACCALAEVMGEENAMSASAFAAGGKISSETVGGWSRSFASTTVSASEVEYLEQKKRDVLTLYLGNVPELAGLFGTTSYKYAKRR